MEGKTEYCRHFENETLEGVRVIYPFLEVGRRKSAEESRRKTWKGEII